MEGSKTIFVAKCILKKIIIFKNRSGTNKTEKLLGIFPFIGIHHCYFCMCKDWWNCTKPNGKLLGDAL